jgi:hypothetical protein
MLYESIRSFQYAGTAAQVIIGVVTVVVSCGSAFIVAARARLYDSRRVGDSR